MSEVLARIRVRETAGIRRFLYPLTAYVSLPPDTDTSSLQLAPLDGVPVPLQVTLWHTGEYRIDFAVSLAPLQQDRDYLNVPVQQDTDYLLTVGIPAAVPDPFQLTYQDGDKLSSVQERFQITLGPPGEVCDVVYDEVHYVSETGFRTGYPTAFRRPNPEDIRYKRGLVMLHNAQKMPLEVVEVATGGGPLAAWHRTKGIYGDGSPVETTLEITACKSWVMLNHRVEQPRRNEVLYFILPLGGDFNVEPIKRTIFDCGIDGIYGQADYFGAYINWFAPEEASSPIRWEVGKGHVYENGQNLSPVNYTGTCSASKFQQQRWFHLVNRTQAVAVAITKMPVGWQSLKIKLRHIISVELEMSEDTVGPVDFGICCHFLNDVPAIAAATNPQSILLPPTVEVLPVA